MPQRVRRLEDGGQSDRSDRSFRCKETQLSLETFWIVGHYLEAGSMYSCFDSIPNGQVEHKLKGL